MQALGGVIAGFDYQVFRATKPPAELVEGARPVRGVSGEDGSLLTIGFPEDGEADADHIVGPTEDRPPAR